jgi:hypothetical protein
MSGVGNLCIGDNKMAANHIDALTHGTPVTPSLLSKTTNEQNSRVGFIYRTTGISTLPLTTNANRGRSYSVVYSYCDIIPYYLR